MIFLILNAWADSTTKVTTDHQLLSGIAHAGIVVQTLLLALVALSIWNWFVIFKKQGEFKKIAKENEDFLSDFWAATNLQQVHAKIDQYASSPLARVFKAGYQEIERVLSSQQQGLMMTGMENLERSTRKSMDEEVASMESNISILATTGSTAPFIGLLGTVIGIMNSFQDIASSGSASLAVVAPGISEALFATAVGLFAAIPAVVAYNYLVNKIKKVENQLSGFNSDFLNIARRNFFKNN
jgi:biopolymer transport protein TolQ